MGLPSDTDEDEFQKYAYRDPTPIEDPKTFNPIAWWDDAKTAFPSLYLYAWDTLAIPAMSAECERVFNSTKKLIVRLFGVRSRNPISSSVISIYLRNELTLIGTNPTGQVSFS